jgi:hypothetical protein
MKFCFFFILVFNFTHTLTSLAQDTLKGKGSDTLLFSGQLSAWVNYNPSNDLSLWLGGRYIPQLNYSHRLPNEKLIDFEVSANVNGSAGFHLFDSSATDGSIRPYRAWARYSTNQFELRDYMGTMIQKPGRSVRQVKGIRNLAEDFKLQCQRGKQAFRFIIAW